MRIIGAKVYDVNEGFVQRDICTDGVNISATSGDDRVIDATGSYIVPGFTDVHFHGCMGHDFSDGNAEGLVEMARYELSRGVTQICPAGMTLLEDQLVRICQVAANHCKTATAGAELCGINLEGPFLSYAKRGAQNGEWLHGTDVQLLNQLIAESDGLVKLVSVAPELDGGIEFIKKISGDVNVSLAHTTADYDVAMAAFDAGARHVTHLYNAMMPFTHRAPGIVGAALDSENVMVELICDDVHIHPSVVRATFKMYGAERVVLISDTMRAAGMSDGEYTLGGQAVTVKGRYATLEGGVLAGSVTDLMSCFQTAVAMGIPMADAVRAAAVNPARAIGIYDRVGSLDEGKLANMVFLGEDMALKSVYFRGEQVEI